MFIVRYAEDADGEGGCGDRCGGAEDCTQNDGTMSDWPASQVWMGGDGGLPTLRLSPEQDTSYLRLAHSQILAADPAAIYGPGLTN